MNWYLFLDVNLTPKNHENWIICRSTEDAIGIIKTHGLPRYMSLGYDLEMRNGIIDNTIIFIEQLKKVWDKKTEPPFYNIHAEELSQRLEIESAMDDWFRIWTP